ncbi:LuxR family transcriptional regulator [Mycolicibacterium chubuense]|uniref:Putative HTH-type transcriptional regulator n=1 Tax=Mycolicibacterium chubuense TaxID=1800 RepID=A0A0J6VJX8_MYCCU|nr:LuxR family transcriptional regulator [Mycolicibacterium chubuense]KMO69758.1 putative HTH-type transcriptional regulator [Mycolicibacterium chubuense]ORA55716.1 LuxR family transcriptional regulator [Mycolicibacterium chubuense]SPX95591.1 transcriptional regulator, luxR family [Mycolicibacterium chubuense]
MSSPEPSLRGRTAECARLDELIAGLKPGACQVLVLRGEAGVGKTALLDYVVARTEKFRRIGVSGVESDMELAYAGLQQLCAPLLEHVDALPAPQCEALDVAFGRGAGDTPDRFLVGLAVLSLLAAAAEIRPLVAVVDDAQWLDQVSLQTLAFVARRLLAEPVALLFAVRDHPELLAGLPDLTVNGLSDDDARALLDSVMLARLDPRVRDRVIAETRGLPLAILEVPRSVSAAELSGGFWIAGKRSSPAAVEQTYVRRIRSLPDTTQRLLLLAAAEPVGDAALFLRAAGLMGIPISELAPAEADGLIEFGPRMRFHHPLIRSAAYRAGDLLHRRDVHRVLADATDPQTDPDRRAWHAALAAAGPDDEIAAELERSAARAQSRGGVAAAATFLERATTLTADPTLRAARALAAAQAKSDAADAAAAHELLAIAELGDLPPLQQALVARLRAQMQFVRSRSGDSGAPAVADTAPPLLEAARTLQRLDDHSSRESYLETIAALMYAGRAADPAALTRAADAALAAMAQVTDRLRPVDLLLQGTAERITGGPGAGTDTLGRAVAAMRAQADDDVAVGRWLRVPAFPILQESAAHELWDPQAVRHLATAAVRHARGSGALAGLPRALAYRAGVHLMAGEFAAAEQLLGEASSIAAATAARSPVRYHEVMLAAWRGDVAEAAKLIDSLTAEAVPRGEGRLQGLLGYAAAVLYNGQGRYEDAFTAAHECCAYPDLGFHGWCAFELVEAATRTGAGDVARDAVARLEVSATAGESDWGLGVLAAARAMTSDGAAADALFGEAVERLGRTDIVVHQARARLQYGEWLRRANRRTAARRELTAAHDLFTAMGARGFAERTRRELVATGEKVRAPAARTGGELTAQEAQIAGLAAEGMTNSEIGASLFISAHTVEWHLRKVFAKLGISSRRQLRTTAFAP